MSSLQALFDAQKAIADGIDRLKALHADQVTALNAQIDALLARNIDACRTIGTLTEENARLLNDVKNLERMRGASYEPVLTPVPQAFGVASNMLPYITQRLGLINFALGATLLSLTFDGKTLAFVFGRTMQLRARSINITDSIEVEVVTQ